MRAPAPSMTVGMAREHRRPLPTHHPVHNAARATGRISHTPIVGAPEHRRQHGEDRRERTAAHLHGASDQLAGAAHGQHHHADPKQPPERRQEGLGGRRVWSHSRRGREHPQAAAQGAEARGRARRSKTVGMTKKRSPPCSTPSLSHGEDVVPSIRCPSRPTTPR
jgi:hypothetical protein